MNTWSGLLLLAAPAAYAWQMLHFRRVWASLLGPLAVASPPSPRSGGEGLAFSSKSGDTSTELGVEEKLETGFSSPPERGLGGEALCVLIAARNEAANLPQLLHDLHRQTLPASRFEVILIDDHSTDATAALVAAAARETPFRLRLLRLAEQPGPPRTGKKAALEAGIAAARTPWLVCTDADCRLPPDWLRLHHRAHLDPAVHFVSGPVLLTGHGALAALQGLELAGLVGTGAAGIGAGRPTMCNGANLSYRRTSFAAVQGFAGNEAIASGDDEFLLHKLHAAFPAGIRFLQEQGAIVRTAAQPTLRQLLRQRVRWASKWRHYRTAAPRRLAVLVLLANVALAGGALALLWLPALWPWVLAGWTLKLGADGLFLGPVLRFFGRRRWLVWVPVLQFAYAPYALLVGLAGLRGSYEWKGRRI